jgi:hypothetical protein
MPAACAKSAQAGQHVDISDGTGSVVGEGLTQTVLLVRAGKRRVDEAK